MAARSTRIAILHLDTPWAVDEGDLVVYADGEIEVVSDPSDLLDYAADAAREDSTYGGPAQDEPVSVFGDTPQRKIQSPNSVICNLIGGKDAWHGFGDYSDVLDALITGMGSKKAKFAAIRKAREYFRPEDDEERREMHALDVACRKEIRKFHGRKH